MVVVVEEWGVGPTDYLVSKAADCWIPGILHPHAGGFHAEALHFQIEPATRDAEEPRRL
jgi:hypothetical protein